MAGKRLIPVIGSFIMVLLLVGSLSPGVLGNQNEVRDRVTDSIIDQLLTFIHSAAEIIGKGLVMLVDTIAGVDVSELQQPLGYLGILTASLIVFGALKAAQKIIWFIVLLGWGLIIVRIVLEALDKSNGQVI